MTVYCCKGIFCYRLSKDTFEYPPPPVEAMNFTKIAQLASVMHVPVAIFESGYVSKFKYLRMAITNRNYIPQEVKLFIKFWECLLSFSSEYSVIPARSSKNLNIKIKNTTISLVLRGPFEKFVDSPYYSESKICGGTVTVSFSKYLP
jgi:hypothetical protein